MRKANENAQFEVNQLFLQLPKCDQLYVTEWKIRKKKKVIATSIVFYKKYV